MTTRATPRRASRAGAGEAARAFGRFQELLVDLPGGRLHETIPFFHHTPRRYTTLEEAAACPSASRTTTPSSTRCSHSQGWNPWAAAHPPARGFSAVNPSACRIAGVTTSLHPWALGCTVSGTSARRRAGSARCNSLHLACTSARRNPRAHGREARTVGHDRLRLPRVQVRGQSICHLRHRFQSQESDDARQRQGTSCHVAPQFCVAVHGVSFLADPPAACGTV
jgi:hypothetical protein